MKPKVLLAMPGKMGDIVWTLPAARQLAATGKDVSYCVMPKYEKVLPLLRGQAWVTAAFSLVGWNEDHDYCGAQPRVPKDGCALPLGYEKIYFLGYTDRPKEPLYLGAYRAMGIVPGLPIVPFIMRNRFNPPLDYAQPYIAYAFNPDYSGVKEVLLNYLMREIGTDRFVDLSQWPIEKAHEVIRDSSFYFGDRSLNYVLAHGVGKRCLTFEPTPGRLDPIFSFPWGHECITDGRPEGVRNIMERWLSDAGSQS